MDEGYLVEQSKKGDKGAFSTLVELYQNRLYKTACAILGNSQDANDALQDCVLKAYLSIDSLRNDFYFKYWMNRILVNSCNDIYRRRKKVVYIEDEEIRSEHDEIDDSGLDVRIAMGKLNSKYRSILALRYYQDLSYEDIAEILNCPTGTIKSRINYALKKLREVIDRGYMEEVEK
jgi:RNA polymerase sigma-70 factor (ECF subfamily)